MSVTDQEVAALRALLVRDWIEHERLYGELGEGQVARSYLPLLSCAFFEAVVRHFKGRKRSEMIEWVADVRTRMDAGDKIDPDVAEQLILWAFGKGTTDGIDGSVSYEHQGMLLAVLVEEQQFDAAGLDAFLAKARADADAAVA